MMKQLAAIGAIGVFSTCLFAQGLTSSQTKDQWEEINFEFNSSVLSDGYPSLLRLAELLGEHRDYHVKLVGNTDFVGSARYNDRLATRRAETVRDFLVKYGAAADQITTSGDGKKAPEVDNKTKEGRFMNRRVVMTVTDGQGRIVAAGGVADIMPILQESLKKQEECCSNILKRLDKLDDILAALRDLKGENDRLKGQVAELQNHEKVLEDKVNGGPKGVTKEEVAAVAEKAGKDAVDEAQKRNKKFSLLGLDVGPTMGNRPSGDVTVQGRGQFFSPFGAEGSHAVQAEGEYLRYPGSQEGQFDIGLVNRWDHLQAGLFSSFKYIRLSQYENGGSMAQGAFLLDYLFSRGRIGFFGTEGFKNTGALTETPLGLTSFLETYARPMNQFGFDTQVGVWGDAWIQGNFAYIHSHSSTPNRPGGEIKLVQPFSKELAFTVRAGLNPTLLTDKNTGELTVGLEFGNFMRPKEYTTFTHPVPMDVPRIRYEFLTRQVGHSAPIADAGPPQIGVPPGTVTLNGTGSYSPDHDALNYSWTQIAGPNVAISGANMATATFTALGSTSYGFRLTVTDQLTGLSGTATTTVTTQKALQVVQFSATPSSIASGQSSTLAWNVTNATSVTISGVGSGLNAAGTASVSPTKTTTYNLTASGQGGQTVTASVTVTVGASKPAVVRFAASPTSISKGGSSLLSWTTKGATTVSINNGVGSVSASGSATVSPTATTTYTLTATGADGVTSVTAAVTVTVVAPKPIIIRFTAAPTSIAKGGSTILSWATTGATTASISNGVGSVPVNGSQSVSPTATTTYTLTATAADGVTSVTAAVTVNVLGAKPAIVRFAASQTSIAKGGSTILSWATTGATTATIDNGVGSVPVNGSTTVSPAATTTYTLTATAADGVTSVTASVTVTVTVPKAPAIVRFAASPTSISSGGSSLLSWTTTGAATVSINNGVGTVSANGSVTVSPTATTTYTLTATGADGVTSVTAAVTVTVLGSKPPAIVRFAASQYHIAQGGSTILSWTTTGASTVNISNGVGNVPVNGSQSVSPAATTTYTLTATGADGVTSVTASVTITVGGGAVPTVLSFTASPTVIAAGGQASLCWNVTNATTVSIAPGVGTVNPVACANVTPAATTTYVLTATNAVGPTQASVTVTVGSVQILTFTANPTFSPAPGEPVVLTWTTQGATSVILTGSFVPSGNQPANGSVTINPTTDSEYTLTAYGPGGPVSSVVYVHVR